MVLPLIASLFGALPSPGLKTFLTLAGALTITLIALTCYIAGKAGKDEAVMAAITQTNLEWSLKLQTVKDEHARTLAEARRAAALEPPTPADRAERLQLCRTSPTCRERGAGKK